MALNNTHFGYEEINKIIGNAPKKIFFLGIGGISMNSLAKVCALRGHTVAGYDRTRTDITDSLEEMGIKVYFESSAEAVADCDALVYTVAMPESDPAYIYAGEHGIPRISRADFLGYIMMGYNSRIGISGMHGKSTTTAIVSSVYRAAGADPTVFGGAEIKGMSSSNIIGGHDVFVFEACEYMDSFLDFYPTTAIVLNIEMDHVDYFHSMEQICNSFTAFMSKSDRVIANIGDKNVTDSAKRSGAKIVTFGATGSGADYTSENISFCHGFSSFDIFYRGEKLCRTEMHVPGHHIVTDALAAAAVAHSDGLAPADIARGLAEYTGIGRRMELRGKTAAEADVFDDYAHHPTEIKTTLQAAAEMEYKKTVCVFQPHTFSRTAELLDGFADALASSDVDELILAPIYPAREKNTYGISSEILAEKVREKGGKCTSYDSFEGISEYLKNTLRDGDAVFIVGAGDVNRISDMILACPACQD